MRGKKISMWHVVYGESWVTEFWDRHFPDANAGDRSLYDFRFVDIANLFSVYDEKFIDMLALLTIMPYDEITAEIKEQFYKPERSERSFIAYLAYTYNLTKKQVRRRIKYLDLYTRGYMATKDVKLLPPAAEADAE